jgi:uncharacterized protein (DUF4415 family)
MRVIGLGTNQDRSFGRLKMAKASRGGQSRSRPAPATKTRARALAPKALAPPRAVVEPARAAWATDLVFDVREPKLAVSLRLDADVLRFFRGFGAGYQTRINEVLKAFMQARGGAEAVSHAVVGARAARSSGSSNGKRASR